MAGIFVFSGAFWYVRVGASDVGSRVYSRVYRKRVMDIYENDAFLH